MPPKKAMIASPDNGSLSVGQATFSLKLVKKRCDLVLRRNALRLFWFFDL